MIKFNQVPQIDPKVLGKLDKYAVADRSKRWYGKAKAVVQFRTDVLAQGLVIQSGRCAWCMLSLGEEGRRTAHRDHIAPKAKHPQWTFLPKNLILACEYCNGFAVKGEIETVATSSKDYDKCIFFLVHPYIDDPTMHLAFDSEDNDNKIVIRGLTAKGTWTIEKLHLDTPGATVERAKDYLYQKRVGNLTPQFRDLFQAARREIGK